jgi:RimJ/RimL family protein N-acetyltransferase
MPYLVAPERCIDERFVIRCYDIDDGPLLTEAVVSSYAHLAPWMPWASADQSEATSQQLVRTFRARYLLAEDFVLGIFAPDEQRLLGGAGFHLREGPLDSRSAEVGMWIRASEAHQGLGTRALRALLYWGFTEWPWLRLSWRCDEANRASVGTAHAAGMRLEGVLRSQAADVGDARRNTMVFALLRDELPTSSE